MLVLELEASGRETERGLPKPRQENAVDYVSRVAARSMRLANGNYSRRGVVDR